MIVGGRSPVRVAVRHHQLVVFVSATEETVRSWWVIVARPGNLQRSGLFRKERGERDRERSPACHCSFDPKAAGWPASAPISSLFLLAFFLLAFLLAAAVTVSSLCASHCHTSVSEIMTLSCFESFPLPFYFVQRWYWN